MKIIIKHRIYQWNIVTSIEKLISIIVSQARNTISMILQPPATLSHHQKRAFWWQSWNLFCFQSLISHFHFPNPNSIIPMTTKHHPPTPEHCPNFTGPSLYKPNSGALRQLPRLNPPTLRPREYKLLCHCNRQYVAVRPVERRYAVVNEMLMVCRRWRCWGHGPWSWDGCRGGPGWRIRKVNGVG